MNVILRRDYRIVLATSLEKIILELALMQKHMTSQRMQNYHHPCQSLYLKTRDHIHYTSFAAVSSALALNQL